MRIATIILGGALLVTSTLATARSGHHPSFGAAQHGHPINAWMGSHHLKLR